MAGTINARIPPGVEQKLAEYCARSGATRTEVLVRALDGYLEEAGSGGDAYALAADLIPSRGTRTVRSDRVRELARKAFGASRAR